MMQKDAADLFASPRVRRGRKRYSEGLRTARRGRVWRSRCSCLALRAPAYLYAKAHLACSPPRG